MHASKILSVILPLALGGCDFFEEEPDSSYSPASTPAPARRPSSNSSYSPPPRSSPHSSYSPPPRTSSIAPRPSGVGPGVSSGSLASPNSPDSPSSLSSPGAGPSSLTPMQDSSAAGPAKSAPSAPPPAASPSEATKALPPAEPASPDWHPSEGQIVRAGELVMELKRSNGGVNPTHGAMVAYLQPRMGISSSQAEAILEELGL